MLTPLPLSQVGAPKGLNSRSLPITNQIEESLNRRPKNDDQGPTTS